MNITIIGSGNVAEAFARAICTASNDIHLLEIYSRNEKRGRELTSLYGSSYASDIKALAPADLYLIAVSDSAISEVSDELKIPENAIVAHVSGGMPIDALCADIKNRAVIYPLQTFSAGHITNFSRIPLFIEYNSPAAGDTTQRFAAALSETVFEVNSARRNKLHIAAVFACNFTNYLYHISSELLREDSLPFDVLKPLILETIAKAMTVDEPSEVQTGPAARGDETTIRRHLDTLAEEGKDKYYEIYKLLSDNIWETLKKT